MKCGAGVRRAGRLGPLLLVGALGLALVAGTTSDAAYNATTGTVGGFGSDTLLAPTAPACAWTGTNSLRVSWTPTATAWAQGYRLLRSDTQVGGYASVTTASGQAATSANDTNPLPPTVRYYTVDSTYGANWVSSPTTAIASNTCDGTITSLYAQGTAGAPSGVAVDSAGNVYTSDQNGARILKTTPGGVTTVVAGTTNTASYTGDGGAATSATLNSPRGIAIDGSGNIYIADSGNHAIRKFTVGGTISTVAGTGVSGYSGDGGAATSAKLKSPLGVSVDSTGTLYIADSSNFVIRKVTAGGTISTFAGSNITGYSGDNGAATSARLATPYDAVSDGNGTVYIADTNNNVIRKVTGGTITTVAGGGANGACTYSGTATGVALNQPKRLAWDGANSRLFIPDYTNSCVRVLSGSTVSLVAGTGTASYSGDNGPAVAAGLNSPAALAYGATVDRLYIAESLNNVVRVLLAP